jgi:hypothetical protein
MRAQVEEMLAHAGEMTERVARAICCEYSNVCADELTEDNDFLPVARRYARAAIAAMREPIEELVAEGVCGDEGRVPGDLCYFFDQALSAFP